MPTAKKPDAPKFKKVEIPGFRREVYALATPEAERNTMLAEDGGRIALQLTTATIERLEVLREYLGAPEGNLFLLLVAVADKYVPDFKVQVGEQKPKGRKKNADRFRIVTAVEAKAAQSKISIAAAIRWVAPNTGQSYSPDSLSTKYYAAVKEIEGNPLTGAYLRLWRKLLPYDAFDDLSDTFSELEREELGAS
jgi:hypothetical protein